MYQLTSPQILAGVSKTGALTVEARRAILMTDIKKISHRHEGVLNWLVSNPHKSQGDCAEALGYTETWLSILIHTDMFQARLLERCEEVGVVCTHTIKNKLIGIAALSLDRTRERLERLGKEEPTERFLLDTTKNVLAAIGYAPANGGVKEQKHLHLHIPVSGEQIAAAREEAAKRVVELEAEVVSG